MSRPLQASINLAAMHKNLSVARRLAGRSRVIAVIKANAYGHGVVRAAGALGAADAFALLEIHDAVRLREAGFRQKILLLEGVFSARELPVVLRHNFTLMVHAEEQLRWLAELPPGASLDVFLKFNTGMNRLGFDCREAGKLISRVQALPCVRELVLVSHFADAEGSGGIGAQMENFERHVARDGLPRSLANSAALLRFPHAHADWVRPGIMLYGASPLPDGTAKDIGLDPAMTLSSRLIAIQNIRRGDTVGYGGVFRAPRDMRIGVVACGYADGYPRHATNGVPVLVEGIRVLIAGRVSMDMLCVDLTPVPHADIGSAVVLWGEGLPVEEVAAAAGTVSYELLCALAPRVPTIEIGRA
ncbi:MAG: alanine racemase [Burkholderiales bacterium]